MNVSEELSAGRPRSSDRYDGDLSWRQLVENMLCERLCLDSSSPLLSFTAVCRLVLTAVSPLCVMHACVVDSALPLSFDSSLPLYDMHVCVFFIAVCRSL